MPYAQLAEHEDIRPRSKRLGFPQQIWHSGPWNLHSHLRDFIFIQSGFQ